MDIDYWESERGVSPVYEFIRSQPPEAQIRIQRTIGYFRERGFQLLQSPLLKKLNGYDIYELRISIQRVCYRIFLIYYKSSSWLVHAFKKKSNNTPQREIDVAEGRRQLIIQTG